MLSDRDIEKLAAIGFVVEGIVKTKTTTFVVHTPSLVSDSHFYDDFDGKFWHYSTEADAWAAVRLYVTCDDGLKAMMADKVRWLGGIDIEAPIIGEKWIASRGLEAPGKGDSPEAAVDALFWKVR